MGEDQHPLFGRLVFSLTSNPSFCQTALGNFGVNESHRLKPLMLPCEDAVIFVAGIGDDGTVIIQVAVLTELVNTDYSFDAELFDDGAHRPTGSIHQRAVQRLWRRGELLPVSFRRPFVFREAVLPPCRFASKNNSILYAILSNN